MLYRSSREGSSKGKPQAPKGLQAADDPKAQTCCARMGQWGGSRLSEQVDTDTGTQKKW